MENLIEIVKNCETYIECLNCLGMNINGSNYIKLKKEINNQNISISHFKSRSDLMKEFNFDIHNKIPINEILIENSQYNSRSALKRRLLNEKTFNYECVFCGNDGNWMGKKFSLILDHINGVNNDNRKENLRFLCPNCNATLDTHCGKNVKNRKNTKPKKSIEEILNIRKEKRKVDRPSHEKLINEVNLFGYSATGRKYGVSDKAIRKWLKNYEKYGELG